MYILVDEFGEVYQTDLITQNEKDESDGGVLTIINVKNLKNLTSYFKGEWIELMPWKG